MPLPVFALPTILEKTTGMTRQEGYFPLYWDKSAGKVWIEVKLPLRHGSRTAQFIKSGFLRGLGRSSIKSGFFTFLGG